MKYLKTYKLYESLSVEDLVINANDILLELSDINIKSRCEYFKTSVFDNIIYPDYISVSIGSGDSRFTWIEIEEVIDRLVRYFYLNGYKISVLRIEGDEITNPEEWINARKRRSTIGEVYSLYNLQINFDGVRAINPESRHELY